jgi:hypothetical protein
MQGLQALGEACLPYQSLDDRDEARSHGKILCCGRVGEIALAIEIGADAVDTGKTIHQHPTPSLAHAAARNYG